MDAAHSYFFLIKQNLKSTKNMKQCDSPEGQQFGSIINYFQGATIYNLVINGNMSRNGMENYQTANNTENTKTNYSDEQIAHAIQAICGKGKPIDSKQKWAGAMWLLRWECNYPSRTMDFCEKIATLPLPEDLEYKCDYNNIRAIGTLSFMDEDARHLDTVRYSKNDELIFQQMKGVVIALREELRKTAGMKDRLLAV
jgi:hypothetical protein